MYREIPCFDKDFFFHLRRQGIEMFSESIYIYRECSASWYIFMIGKPITYLFVWGKHTFLLHYCSKINALHQQENG